MKQSSLVLVMLVGGTVFGAGAVAIIATNNPLLFQKQPPSVASTTYVTPQQIAPPTHVNTMYTYDAREYGYTISYPVDWNVRLDEASNQLIIDPPGEDMNPYSQEQGEYTNPTDDIIIRTLIIENLSDHFKTIGVNESLILEESFDGHPGYYFEAPAMEIAYTYLINATSTRYVEISTMGDVSKLELIVRNLTIVEPRPRPEIVKQLIRYTVPNQGYSINHPVGWAVRLSEDPEDSTVIVDPPGEGPNLQGPNETAFVNPADDISITKKTIPNLNQYYVENMINPSLMKPLYIDGKQAWSMIKGQGGSVDYGYLIQLDDTTYLELSTGSSIETVATIALELEFED